jgi:hypothetical protein
MAAIPSREFVKLLYSITIKIILVNDVTYETMLHIHIMCRMHSTGHHKYYPSTDPWWL